MKRDTTLKSGIGSGYVSVIMIFVVICLASLAALSFSAAGSNEELDRKSAKQMTAYYEADTKAKEILAAIDEAAYEASQSGFFSGFEFEQSLSEIEGVTYTKTPEGYDVKWSAEISERLVLSCGAVFYSSPESHDGRRYGSLKWDTEAASDGENVTLNVWDGTF